MDNAKELERTRRQALTAEEEAAALRRRLDRAGAELARLRSRAEPAALVVLTEDEAAAALEVAWRAESTAQVVRPSRRALAAALAAFLRHEGLGGARLWNEETARRVEAAAARLPWGGEGA